MKNTPQVSSSSQAGYRIPGHVLAVYALLLFSLGWLAHQHWADVSSPPAPVDAIAASPPTPITTTAAAHEKPINMTSPPATKTLTESQETAAASSDIAVAIEQSQKAPSGWQKAKSGELPYIAFSAHVYTSAPDKRSVTLNGERYQEGDSPYQGLVIEQIEQDMVIFSFNGEPFILDSLQDWPGGKPGTGIVEGNMPQTSAKPEKTVRTTKK
ncbi:general secretion pathway protein GspB [Dickeya sp. CFBP 2040]|uniref:type II secretion system assembly factor GspB n=1 Tax=Dickeya sp. CFBP 2040 TaxID=2718531 RepID=UPI0014471D34|nr:general secretion pathway protein GspB [Dickeya sp. CFBP 2040]